MKKILSLSVTCFAALLFTVQVSAQSTIIIDNTDIKPVPVKITNPAASITPQIKIPFTEIAANVSNSYAVKISGPSSSNEVKVIEYVLANAPSAKNVTIKLSRGASFNLTVPQVTGGVPYSYSGAVNIVVKQGETVEITIDGDTLGKGILVSGYTLK